MKATSDISRQFCGVGLQIFEEQTFNYLYVEKYKIGNR
jgi:hypothetical protein